MPSRTQLTLAKNAPGANGTPQGLIWFLNSQMDYRELTENIWNATTYHEELRDALLAKESSLYVLGGYGQSC